MCWGARRWGPIRPMSEGAALIWCPFPDAASARVAASALLDERLIACANLVPGLQSLFRWNGERSESSECGVLLKTSAARRARAMERIAAIHPYDTPAITAWAVDADGATLAWLEAETTWHD